MSTNSLHCNAGQCLSSTCARYSSLKYLNVDKTGFGAVCPSPQSEASITFGPRSSKNLISSKLPSPAVIFSNVSSNLLVPILQKVHFPQLSLVVNSKK